MTKFEKWFMTRIIRREVTQGFDHSEKITEMYRMIRVAAEREFYEDNLVTMNSNLTHWHYESLRKPTR
jgi:hypothetical protein